MSLWCHVALVVSCHSRAESSRWKPKRPGEMGKAPGQISQSARAEMTKSARAEDAKRAAQSDMADLPKAAGQNAPPKAARRITESGWAESGKRAPGQFLGIKIDIAIINPKAVKRRKIISKMGPNAASA